MMIKAPTCPDCGKPLKTRKSTACNVCVQKRIAVSKGFIVWTKENTAKLIELYPTLSTAKLTALFPGFSAARINRKAKQLGLYKVNRNLWTPKEKAILVAAYADTNKEALMKMFPKHSIHEIYHKAAELGLFKTKWSPYVRARRCLEGAV